MKNRDLITSNVLDFLLTLYVRVRKNPSLSLIEIQKEYKLPSNINGALKTTKVVIRTGKSRAGKWIWNSGIPDEALADKVIAEYKKQTSTRIATTMKKKESPVKDPVTKETQSKEKVTTIIQQSMSPVLKEQFDILNDKANHITVRLNFLEDLLRTIALQWDIKTLLSGKEI